MKKILILHTWGIGDLIMATPMIRSLSDSGYEIDIIFTSKVNETIVKNAPFINNIFTINRKMDFFRFFRKYDYLVATAGTNPKKIKLLNFIIQSKKVFASFQEKDIHRIDMNLKIVKELLNVSVREPFINIVENEKMIDKYFNKNKKNIGFAVGTGVNQMFKRWDIDKFIQLIDKFENEHILVFIGPDEIDLAEKLRCVSNIKIVKENLENVIYVISKLDFLIGNDSGLLHIGYATKIKTSTIFGMTSEKEIGGYYPWNYHIFLDLDCRPCFHSSTDRVGCKELYCLKDMDVDYVYKKIEENL